MITLLKTIISNIKSPKWRLVYEKRNGDKDVYIIQNPTIMKGSKKTTFSNDFSRTLGQYHIGFRAKCISREGEPRSFYFDKIIHLSKVSLFEQVII